MRCCPPPAFAIARRRATVDALVAGRFRDQSLTAALRRSPHQPPSAFAAPVVGWLLRCCPPPAIDIAHRRATVDALVASCFCRQPRVVDVVALAFVLRRPLVLSSRRLVVACCVASVAGITSLLADCCVHPAPPLASSRRCHQRDPSSPYAPSRTDENCGVPRWSAGQPSPSLTLSQTTQLPPTQPPSACHRHRLANSRHDHMEEDASRRGGRPPQGARLALSAHPLSLCRPPPNRVASRPPIQSSWPPSCPFVAKAGCCLSRCLCCWHLCRRCARTDALVALASSPLLRWHICQSPPPPLPSSIATVNLRHQPAPPHSNAISLSPSSHRSPLTPSNAATAI